MADNENREKKGLRILLLIVLVYALVVAGVAIYVKLDKAGFFVWSDENEAVIEAVAVKEPSVPLIEKEQPVSIEDKNEEDSLTISPVEKDIEPSMPVAVAPDVKTVHKQKKEILEIEDQDIDYSPYEDGTTIADVPARPRPEQSETKDAENEDVLSASDLALEVERPKSFIESVVESITNFFASEEKGEKALPAEKLPAASEVNGEIEEMKSKFKFEKESNGVTWIDHIARPNPYTENGFYIYMGLTPEGRVYHRTIIQHSGREWIGLKSILLQIDISDRALIIDAEDNLQTKEIAELHSKNEWIDLPPTQENNDLLNAVVKSNVVKLTFIGEHQNIEWTLTEKELSMLQESMHFYNLLKDREKLLNQKK